MDGYRTDNQFPIRIELCDPTSPPNNLLREEFIDELHIVRLKEVSQWPLQQRWKEKEIMNKMKTNLELLRVRNLVTLTIQIVGVQRRAFSRHAHSSIHDTLHRGAMGRMSGSGS